MPERPAKCGENEGLSSTLKAEGISKGTALDRRRLKQEGLQGKPDRPDDYAEWYYSVLTRNALGEVAIAAQQSAVVVQPSDVQFEGLWV